MLSGEVWRNDKRFFAVIFRMVFAENMKMKQGKLGKIGMRGLQVRRVKIRESPLAAESIVDSDGLRIMAAVVHILILLLWGGGGAIDDPHNPERPE